MMTSRDRIVREGLGVVAPLVWLGLVLVPFYLAWDRLPEPMATHWALSGEPNDSQPRVAALLVMAALAGVPAIVAFAITRRVPRRRGELVLGLGIAAYMGCMGAACAIPTIVCNLDAASWREARPLALGWLAAMIGVPALVAVAVGRLARRLESLPDNAPAGRPSVGLGATERALWSGTASNPWFAVMAVGQVVGGLAALLLLPPLVPAIVVVTGLVVGLFAVVRVRVDGGGVLVAYGPLGFPRQRVPLARIRGARTIDVVPLRHGGWGYRGSLIAFRRAAIVVRGGAGIELDCGDRGHLVITVDDAATAAGLVNDLVDRRRSG
jgi:Protein of unknown function (DUF1648)